MAKNRSAACHLEIQTHGKNPIGVIRSSFREDGKIKHICLGRLNGMSLEQLWIRSRKVPERALLNGLESG